MNKNWKYQARCSFCKKWTKGSGLRWQLAFPCSCTIHPIPSDINIERIREHFNNFINSFNEK